MDIFLRTFGQECSRSASYTSFGLRQGCGKLPNGSWLNDNPAAGRCTRRIINCERIWHVGEEDNCARNIREDVPNYATTQFREADQRKHIQGHFFIAAITNAQRIDATGWSDGYTVSFRNSNCFCKTSCAAPNAPRRSSGGRTVMASSFVFTGIAFSRIARRKGPRNRSPVRHSSP